MKARPVRIIGRPESTEQVMRVVTNQSVNREVTCAGTLRFLMSRGLSEQQAKKLLGLK